MNGLDIQEHLAVKPKLPGRRGNFATMIRTIMTTAAAVAGLMLCSGCATIIRGSDQNMIVNTDPEGASCIFKRDGKEIYTIAETPQTIKLDKSVDDIQATCSLEGYKDTDYTIVSSLDASVGGSLLLGGPIGAGIDAATGAMNKYPVNVNIVMRPKN